jgi:hypothetical protein
MALRRFAAEWRSLALTLIALASATVWAAEARGPEVYIECVAIAVIHVRFRMAAARAKGWKRPVHLLIAAGALAAGLEVHPAFLLPFPIVAYELVAYDSWPDWCKMIAPAILLPVVPDDWRTAYGIAAAIAFVSLHGFHTDARRIKLLQDELERCAGMPRESEPDPDETGASAGQAHPNQTP